MKKVDDVIRAIALCTSLGSSCLGCPYHSVHDCTTEMELDATPIGGFQETVVFLDMIERIKEQAIT